jgi:hypothetical protein
MRAEFALIDNGMDFVIGRWPQPWAVMSDLRPLSKAPDLFAPDANASAFAAIARPGARSSVTGVNHVFAYPEPRKVRVPEWLGDINQRNNNRRCFNALTPYSPLQFRKLLRVF